MSKIYAPEFWQRPPTVLERMQGLESLVGKLQDQLALQVKVLASLAAHSVDVNRGKKISPVEGGFSFPFDWQAEIPGICDLNIVEDREAGKIVVRICDPSPRPVQSDPGWAVSELDKVLAEES